MIAHLIFAKIFCVIIALIFLYKIMAKINSKIITENRLMNNKTFRFASHSHLYVPNPSNMLP